MIIIGIAGGTGSGKTTVVRKVVESLPKGIVSVIPQDSYYKDLSKLPLEQRLETNFDEPDAFEWDLLISQLTELRKGEIIQQPIYEFVTCSRMKETIEVKPTKVVIIEGILAFCNRRLREMMDIKVFVDADGDDRLIRVMRRDVIERGRTIEKAIERYEHTLKPMHLKYIEPTKRYANLIIPEGGNNRVAIDLLTNYIRTIL